MRSHQDTSLDTLLETAILEEGERVAEALASGREVMDANQVADWVSFTVRRLLFRLGADRMSRP